MNIHLRTFAAGCAFTLVVFAASSFGASAPLKNPKPTHGIGTAVTWKAADAPAEGPSDHDRLIAAIKRIDRLQVKLAHTSETANVAADDAANALSLTNCITGGVGLAENFDGTIVDAKAAGDNPIDSFVLPTLSDDCVSEIG